MGNRKVRRTATTLAGTGFSTDQLDELIASLQEPDPVEDPGPVEPPEVATTQRGDVWLLDKHRLMCGDSTSTLDFALLMRGERTSLLGTDPPYCVDYTDADRPIHDGKPSGEARARQWRRKWSI